MLKNYINHLKNEVVAGLEDNITGIKQVVTYVLHPLDTGKKMITTIVTALQNPLQTIKNIGNHLKNFSIGFWQHPIRVTTNLSLSYLEGRMLGEVLDVVTTTPQIQTLSEQIYFSNSTKISATNSLTSMNAFSNFQQGSRSLASGTCSAGGCTFPANSLAATGSTSTIISVNKRKKN